MQIAVAIASRLAAPAILAGALAGSCLAETTPAADAVAAQCARLFFPADVLAQSLDAIPGLTRLPLASLEPDGEHGRALRMALGYHRALSSILATDLVAPEDQLLREFQAIVADTPWLFSEPGRGGGIAAYAHAQGQIFVIDRAYTTGRQGRRETRCLFIAPIGTTPLAPTLPDTLRVTDTPAFSVRGFSVSALRGRIPYSDDPSQSSGSAGFSMVTLPIPAGTPIADLAQIGGVTVFGQTTSNRRIE